MIEQYESKQPGRYQIEWNPQGSSSGVYFYRLQAGALVETRGCYCSSRSASQCFARRWLVAFYNTTALTVDSLCTEQGAMPISTSS